MATSSDEVEHLTLDSWTTVESMLRQVSSTGSRIRASYADAIMYSYKPTSHDGVRRYIVKFLVFLISIITDQGLAAQRPCVGLRPRSGNARRTATLRIRTASRTAWRSHSEGL